MSAVLKKIRKQKESEKPSFPEVYVHRPMIVCNKGLSHSTAEIFDDFIKLIPHAIKGSKISKEDNTTIKEIADDDHCDTICLFQCKHHIEPYMYLAKNPDGPTVCFFIEEEKSINDLAFVGNSMKGSRPLCFFDPALNKDTVFEMSKELLGNLFEVPYKNKHSKPFVDRCMSFMRENDKIIIRQYQIQWEEEPVLVEIGPRLTLVPIYILGGVMNGPKLWKNDLFVSPTAERRENFKNEADAKRAERDKRAKKEMRRMAIPAIKDKHKGLFAPTQ